MNMRNHPSRRLPLRKTPIWLDANYRKLSRNAETHVVRYIRRRRWINTTRANLSTSGNRLKLLEHLPEIFKNVPDAFWSPSVYKTLLNALLMTQYPHLQLEPPDGRVMNLVVLSGQPLRIRKPLRPFVQNTPVVEAAAPALKAASNWLKAAPNQRDEYSDLEQLIRTRGEGNGRKLGPIYDRVAELLGYQGGFVLAPNGWSTRANALAKTLRAARTRRT